MNAYVTLLCLYYIFRQPVVSIYLLFYIKYHHLSYFSLFYQLPTPVKMKLSGNGNNSYNCLSQYLVNSYCEYMCIFSWEQSECRTLNPHLLLHSLHTYMTTFFFVVILFFYQVLLYWSVIYWILNISKQTYS